MALKPSKTMYKRSLGVLAALIILGFGTGLVRLAKLQLIDGEMYRAKAESQQLGDRSIQALRGTIYDRNMRPLAQSATAWKVFIDPSNIKNEKMEKMSATEAEAALTVRRELVADGLSKILSVDKEEILKKAEKLKSGYQKIKSEVTLEEKQQVSSFIAENKLYDCIGIEPDTTRYYPFKTLASTIIGFTGMDDVGVEGLEHKYDSELTGIPGRIISAKNGAMGSMPIEYTASYEPQQGTSLVLTIDETIQSLLEKELNKVYVSSEGNAAYGLVMDVKTGAILAMSNQPDYDLNDPYTILDAEVLARINKITDPAEKNQAVSFARQAQWRNRTISDTYEPGSVFKVVTLAAGLEEGVVNEKTTYTCVGGIQVADNFIKCHKHSGHGTQTLQQGLMNSCNPFFITVGQRLGTDKFFRYFEAFGFTEPTGIDLSGEATPKAGATYHNRDNFGISQLSSCAFGQTFQVSPIQMITAIAAIANGGKLMRPYVVAKKLDGDGNVIEETQPLVRRQVVSAQTARKVIDMMEAVVSDGTGRNANVAGYHVAGKTGTSQKIGAGNGKYIASFACVAPGDDPEIAILITVDEPVGQVNGGQLAAPVAAALVEGIMNYMGIEPEYSEKESSLIEVPAPSLVNATVTAATATAKEQNLSVKVIGDGDHVVRQVPSYGQLMPHKGVIILYTDSRQEETVQVPALTGMRLSTVQKICNEYGLNLKIRGNAFTGADILSYSQDIEPDTVVKYGAVVTVSFKSYSGVSDSIYG